MGVLYLDLYLLLTSCNVKVPVVKTEVKISTNCYTKEKKAGLFWLCSDLKLSVIKM
jgi:hypothetical protein